eukprot:TRINITY_DN2167_c0_g1_i16.p1 TRINITY_DN2167_c0_g1~~TRINITY_DN2167_c0_g1_i16.p1  ORF type:complete len:256 (+),score=39.65 TRINITY_DN2167_c0_g1_i16:773-1540(+)
MQSYNSRLGSHVLMTPHTVVWMCRNCKGVPGNCENVEGIVYCIPPIPDFPFSAADTLDMAVEELCIYNFFKNKDKARSWWTYMTKLSECNYSSVNDPCVKKIKREMKIDAKDLEQCRVMKASTIFDEFIAWQMAGVPYSPAVVINNKVYRGSLDAEHVFQSICAGFNVTPSVCHPDYVATEYFSSNATTWKLLGLVLAAILINLMVILCYRRYARREIKEEMQTQISSIMTNYFLMNDNKATQATTSVMSTEEHS